MLSQNDFQPTPKYRRYVLFLLTGVSVFSFIDRQILVILAEPIKKDLGLSDAQIGLLTGLAFAFFYVIVSIPIARYADKSNRKNIIVVALTVWSSMTALAGFAQTYLHLLLTRVGVGIGEAGGSPPAYAIISDYYPPQKRATAISIYSTGIYIGIFLGFLIGGIIGKIYGWRIALFSLGIPGVLYAIIIYYTVKEPPRGLTDKVKDMQERSFWEVTRILFSKKTFLFLSFAGSMQAFINYGIGNFRPSFLMRIHEMDLADLSIVLSICAGVGGSFGTFMGGYMSDQMRKKDIRWYIWIPLIGAVLNLITCSFFIFSNNLNIVIISIFCTSIASSLYLAPSIAVTHSLVSAKMRALTSALFILILNAIGLGLGPLTIGLLSDYFTSIYGTTALRYSFYIVYAIAPISMLLFYMASLSYKKEILNKEVV